MEDFEGDFGEFVHMFALIIVLISRLPAPLLVALFAEDKRGSTASLMRASSAQEG